MSTTKDTWYILKRHFSGGEVDFYACAYPTGSVVTPHVFGRTHKYARISPSDLREIVYADKVVFRAGKPKGGWNSEPPADGSEIESGAVLELILKSQQNDQEWDNLDQLEKMTANVEIHPVPMGEINKAKAKAR